MNPQKLSFIIPAKDEQATIITLHSQIAAVVTGLGLPYEIIFIDDGSGDDTWNVMLGLSALHPATVRAVRMRRNIGKARALAHGFSLARGDVVFTLDADLQDDPQEIPRFLAKLAEGYDIVSGYKQTRHDPWHKVWPSRVFNWMLSRLNGVRLHDHNCGFKCYRAEVVHAVRLYGEMHRMVPSLASMEGFRSSEIVVQHHPRRFGQSKYGVKRFLRGFLDMITVWFLKNYRERPQHLFGSWALTCFTLGGFAAVAGILVPSVLHQALLAAVLVAVFCTAAAVLFGLGLVAELYTSNRRGATDTPPVVADSATDYSPPQPELRPLAGFGSGEAAEVLVVDDNPAARTLMARALRHEPVKVVEAENGQDAISKVTARTRVVLLDLEMPVMNGLTCLRHLAKVHSEIPVIVITSALDVPRAVTAMRAGAFNYFVRPLDNQQLVQQVRLALKAHEVAVAQDCINA